MTEKNAKIEKAIQLAELQKDLADLVRQAQAVNGAIQYIQQKIANLSPKPEPDKKE